MIKLKNIHWNINIFDYIWLFIVTKAKVNVFFYVCLFILIIRVFNKIMNNWNWKTKWHFVH